MFIFLIQMFMMILLFYTQFLEPLLNRHDEEKEEHPFMLLAIKVLCSIMLHLSLQPQVNYSLDRM